MGHTGDVIGDCGIMIPAWVKLVVAKGENAEQAHGVE
jgi:hypothetical protein